MIDAVELCLVYVRQLSGLYNRDTIKDDDIPVMIALGHDYLALLTMLGWGIGANELQIGIVAPYTVKVRARSLVQRDTAQIVSLSSLLNFLPFISLIRNTLRYIA